MNTCDTEIMTINFIRLRKIMKICLFVAWKRCVTSAKITVDTKWSFLKIIRIGKNQNARAIVVNDPERKFWSKNKKNWTEIKFSSHIIIFSPCSSYTLLYTISAVRSIRFSKGNRTFSIVPVISLSGIVRHRTISKAKNSRLVPPR